MNSFKKELVRIGVCDERGIAYCLHATSMPGDIKGAVFLALKGDVLSIYERDIMRFAKWDFEPIRSIRIREITELQIKYPFIVFGGKLSFRYNGEALAFNFEKKALAAAIEHEYGR